MTFDRFKELATERIAAELTDIQAERLHAVCCELAENNAKFNLTAIKDDEGVISKHVADCVACAEHLRTLVPLSGRILDVGSGAGFPSLPLAIMLDGATVTALDSTAKKTAYIAATSEKIGLSNMHTLTGRAEDFAHDPDYREQFGIVTARAVSRLNVLLEITAPFVKLGGYVVAMKGAMADEEAAEAASAAKKLGLAPAKTVSYILPKMEDNRAFVIYKKIEQTATKFPRQYAKITKSPL